MTVTRFTNNLDKVTHLLLDLDDTLYRVEGVPSFVRDQIEHYMREKLRIPSEHVKELCNKLYLSHGTTLCGLVATGFTIDYDDWHAEVHATIDYPKLLAPDAALRELLLSIKLPKYILTNADQKHMDVCLDLLGIRDCFEGFFYFENVQEAAARRGLLHDAQQVLCKPNPQVYELVLSMLGCSAEHALFFDDSTRNVAAAHTVGINTVLVGRTEAVAGADVCIADMHDIPRLLPRLLRACERDDTVSEHVVPDAASMTVSVACTH